MPFSFSLQQKHCTTTLDEKRFFAVCLSQLLSWLSGVLSSYGTYIQRTAKNEVKNMKSAIYNLKKRKPIYRIRSPEAKKKQKLMVIVIGIPHPLDPLGIPHLAHKKYPLLS